MNTVRTTMRPHEEIEVSDAELLDLQRQGLLVEDEKPAPVEEKPATEKKMEGVKRDGSISN